MKKWNKFPKSVLNSLSIKEKTIKYPAKFRPKITIIIQNVRKKFNQVVT